MTTYHAKGKTFVLEEQDQIMFKNSKGKIVVMGYNHSRPWREALNA